MPKSGFTLVELLVVISITAIVAVITLSNYKSFGEDQALKSAVLDVQSQFRTAQTNATTNVKCKNEYGATWQTEFDDSTTIKLRCEEPADSSTKRELNLKDGIEINSVSGNPAGSCPDGPEFSIDFTPLTGKIEFIDEEGDPMSNCASVVVTFENTKTGALRSLTIEQGGQIYAQ